MKKDKTNSNGFTLLQILLIVMAMILLSYFKWFLSDREKEIENRQLQEMVDYHRSQGRDITVFE